jgi:transcriptional regulator with XRE-family HTH domain
MGTVVLKMTAADLKRTLKALGWTQAHLAERLGVDLATVSRWANGHLPVPKYAVAFLDLALKVKDFSDDCCQPR